MKLSQPSPYWFKKEGIEHIEKEYNVQYLGPWCVKNKHGNWSEFPLDVFYAADPDKSKGHSHYVGFYREGGHIMIADASSAFSKLPMLGIEEDGLVYVSRYRHDATGPSSGFYIDGGRDYLHTNYAGNLVKVSLYDNEFVFE